MKWKKNISVEVEETNRNHHKTKETQTNVVNAQKRHSTTHTFDQRCDRVERQSKVKPECNSFFFRWRCVPSYDHDRARSFFNGNRWRVKELESLGDCDSATMQLTMVAINVQFDYIRQAEIIVADGKYTLAPFRSIEACTIDCVYNAKGEKFTVIINSTMRSVD